MKINGNLKIREILVYFILGDILLTYGYFYFDYVERKNILLIIGMTLKVIIEYLFMFYLWSPVRYEEYDEKNPSTGILEWSFLFLLEYIFNIMAVFNKNIHFVNLIQSYILMFFLLFTIRFWNFYRNIRLEEGIKNQIEKDIITIVNLWIGFSLFDGCHK